MNRNTMQIKQHLRTALAVQGLALLAATNFGNAAYAGHYRDSLGEGVASDSGTATPASVVSGQYRFVTIDIPGAVHPDAFGVNDEGMVSGAYNDTNGIYHSFLWSDGHLSIVDAPPPWLDVLLGGINNAGVIAANYDDGNVSHAALYSVLGQTWTQLPDVAGYPVNNGNGINNLGVAVGAAYEGTLLGSANANTVTNGIGWIWDGANYSYIIIPSAVGTVDGTTLSSINDSGTVVGYYGDSAGMDHGFQKQGTMITTIDYPKATSTKLYGINNWGEVVGGYDDKKGFEHGWIKNQSGFVTVDFPKAVATAIYAMNNFGVIVGAYLDKGGHVYAWVGYPTQ